MRIAIGEGKNARLKITEDEITFDQFAEQCSKPLKGDKWGWYFLRGFDLRESLEHDGYHRNDVSLKSSEFLIIDADSSSADKDSAPSAKAGHEALIKLGYTHFIYTSHSQTDKNNKWRAVLPCKIAEKTTDENRAKLKATYFQLIKDLQGIGLDIAPTRESYVWSQPWYMPTRDNPNDGLFEHYSWFDGVSPDVISVKPKADNEQLDTTAQMTDEETVEGIIHELITAKHCHTAVRKLLYMKAKDGIAKEAACAEVAALMQINKTHKDWQIVYEGIPKSFIDAKKKIDDEQQAFVEKINVADNTTKLIGSLNEDVLAPKDSLFGDLVRAIYSNSAAPNLIVANMAARATIAYLAGGNYTISGFNDRTNLQQIVIGGSGTGKDTAMRAPAWIVNAAFIDKANIASILIQGIQSDMASEQGMDDQLRTIANKINKHDILFCRDELGKDIKHATKGNSTKAGIFDYLLRAYTLSSEPLVPPRLMSKRGKSKNDGAGLEVHLVHPGINIIGATVERSLVDGLNIDFVTSGSCARFLALPCDFHASGVSEPKHNSGIQLSKEIIANIQYMVSMDGMGNGNVPNAVTNREVRNARKVKLDDHLKKEILRIVNEDNARRNGEDDFAAIWNRRGVNAKKLAMCEAILENPKKPVITEEMMERGMKIATASCKYFESMFNINVGENDFDLAKKKVLMKLEGVMPRGKDPRHERGWVPRRALVRLRAVKAIGEKVERLFDVMERDGDIYKRLKENVRGRPTELFRFKEH